MKRKCPKCQKIFDWGKEIKDWMKCHGDDWEEWAELMIYCYNCENYIGCVSFEEMVFKTKMIKSPGMKQKVKVPML